MARGFVGLRLDEIPEGLACRECSFIVPANSKHAINSLRSHQRNSHEGWAEEKRVKWQFLSLIDVTGSFDLALHYADDVITWTNRPADEVLKEWAIQAEELDEEDRPLLTEKQVARMERRLRRIDEWKGRKALDLNRRASMRLSQQVIDTGATDKPQLVQYLGMNNAYQTRELAMAYPMQRAQKPRGNVRVKSVQRQPEQKQLPAPQTVNAEFRVVDGS